jgi:phage N-6-adenine-methyltransferase
VSDTIGNQRWRTPQWLFALCEELLERRLVLDAAAEACNAKCKKFYTREQNGLLLPWVDGTFCNPGYNHFGAWIQHAVAECRAKQIHAALIGPKGCSQQWFHRHAIQGRVYAPDQRIAFDHYDTGEPTITAREDSMIYLLGPRVWNRSKTAFDYRPLVVSKRRAA